MFSMIKSFFSADYKKKQLNKSLYLDKFKDILKSNNFNEENKSKLLNLSKEYLLNDADLKDVHKKLCENHLIMLNNNSFVTDQDIDFCDEIFSFCKLEAEEVSMNLFMPISVKHNLWKIDNGILPSLDWNKISIIPRKNEILHWASEAELVKLKSVTTRINYGGLHASLKICKGLSYRIGSITPQFSKTEVLTLVDSGTFWITNQRLGFIGDRKNFSFPYNKLLSIEVNNSIGLILHKDGNTNPHMLNIGNYDIPCSIISKIINTI